MGREFISAPLISVPVLLSKKSSQLRPQCNAREDEDGQSKIEARSQQNASREALYVLKVDTRGPCYLNPLVDMLMGTMYGGAL
jgi:hypothetical protein